MIKIRVPGPKSAHFSRPRREPIGSRLWLCWPQSGAMAKSNSAGKKPMGSGMQQTTLVARRSVVSPSNGSPKSDQLGLGGKKNRKKKKAPTHKKMCVTPRPGNPKTGCSNQPAPAHAAMHLCAALPQTRTRSSSRSQASRLLASFDAHPHADLAPVHCGRHLHPDAARDQAQGHFVRPGGVLLRGLSTNESSSPAHLPGRRRTGGLNFK